MCLILFCKRDFSLISLIKDFVFISLIGNKQVKAYENWCHNTFSFGVYIGMETLAITTRKGRKEKNDAIREKKFEGLPLSLFCHLC